VSDADAKPVGGLLAGEGAADFTCHSAVPFHACHAVPRHASPSHATAIDWPGAAEVGLLIAFIFASLLCRFRMLPQIVAIVRRLKLRHFRLLSAMPCRAGRSMPVSILGSLW
jgi:hypothetical protein